MYSIQELPSFHSARDGQDATQPTVPTVPTDATLVCEAQFQNIRLQVMDAHHDTITGALYICQQLVVFYSAERACGMTIEYPLIGLHALDTAGQCVYCQVQGDPTTVSTYFNLTLDPVDDDSDDEEDQGCELQFITDNPSELSIMFAALSKCAALHPDQGDNDELEPAWDMDELMDSMKLAQFEDGE
jgi:hypothetical protein